ncbi:DUF4439 domain-containing protein [Sinomonas sp. P47F7]|uniref:DUF4439 domain-containing protein n=1 Tax=Sinomonas sp. P47F7 TaxID=3410987 RepID=UPI003BF523A2
MIEPVNSTTPPTDPPRRAWRYWVAGAVAVLVALGTATAVALQPQPSPGPSRSELALRSAQDDAARLAAWARSAEGTRQTTAGVRDALASAASVLGRQASLLASRPGASASADPSRSASSGGASGSGASGSGASGSGASGSGSAGSGSTGSGSTGSAGSPGEVVARLTASVDARLAALPDVDGPTAALLASLAAGQSLQADGIAAAAGLSPQQPQQPSAATTATGPSSTPPPSACPGAPAAASPPATAATRQSAAATIPSPAAPAVSAASGVSFADALAAVDRAEAASEYTLETALARSAQGSSDAAARAAALDAHRRQLTAVAALASAACVTLPAQDAGFAVPQGFATDPTPALAAVAESAAESWAQLVGAAPADRRGAAAQGLFAAGKLVAGAAPSSAPAFPGLPAAN